MGSMRAGFRSSVSAITVDVLGSTQLNFTRGACPAVLQPKADTAMKFFPKHTDIAFCLAYTALFARLRFKFKVALKVQKGSLHQLKSAEL